jgi:hypothetical protein
MSVRDELTALLARWDAKESVGLEIDRVLNGRGNYEGLRELLSCVTPSLPAGAEG